MGAPPYTRIDIINEGLSQAGRVDLTSNGRKWLNLFLQKVYTNWDWPWLRKYSGIIALSQNQSFLSDYRAMSSSPTLYINQSGVNVPQREMPTMSSDEFMAIQRIGNITLSQPRKVYIDQNLNQFVFWPGPDTAYSWAYYYFSMPTIPTDADNTADANVPLWPNLPQDVLIRAIQYKAKYFNDDEKYSEEEAALMKEIGLAKFNNYDVRGGSNKIKLGKSFRRRY